MEWFTIADNRPPRSAWIWTSSTEDKSDKVMAQTCKVGKCPVCDLKCMKHPIYWALPTPEDAEKAERDRRRHKGGELHVYNPRS